MIPTSPAFAHKCLPFLLPFFSLSPPSLLKLLSYLLSALVGSPSHQEEGTQEGFWTKNSSGKIQLLPSRLRYPLHSMLYIGCAATSSCKSHSSTLMLMLTESSIQTIFYYSTSTINMVWYIWSPFPHISLTPLAYHPVSPPSSIPSSHPITLWLKTSNSLVLYWGGGATYPGFSFLLEFPRTMPRGSIEAIVPTRAIKKPPRSWISIWLGGDDIITPGFASRSVLNICRIRMKG